MGVVQFLGCCKQSRLYGCNLVGLARTTLRMVGDVFSLLMSLEPPVAPEAKDSCAYTAEVLQNIGIIAGTPMGIEVGTFLQMLFKSITAALKRAEWAFLCCASHID
jgi:hypothetical protein